MAYSKYKNIKKVADKFDLTIQPGELFPKDLPLIEPSEWLLQTLEMMSEQGYDTEKERSERLIAPIFAEYRHRNKNKLTIYSGHELNVDPKNDLNGECDFLMALGDKVLEFLDTPIFSIVEAKKQDFDLGLGQCTAQMIGAQKYNEMDGKPTPFIYGATTDGVKWRFMKLKNKTLTIDKEYYQLGLLPRLLTVLQFIFEDCEKMAQNTEGSSSL
jgi:hypothetical protein